MEQKYSELVDRIAEGLTTQDDAEVVSILITELEDLRLKVAALEDHGED